MSTSQQNILVLGASGRTGRLVVADALSRGYKVSVLVRKASSLEPAEGLTIIEGTPLKIEDIRRAVKASGPITTIVSTLGQTRASGSPWASPTSPKSLMADSTSNAIAVAKDTNISKLVIMSLFGVGDSWKNNNFLIKTVFKHSNMWQTVEDGNAVDAVVKSSGLNFVLVRSTALMGTELKPIQELGDNGEKASFMPSISPQSVSKFLLDAVESDRWDRQTPVISN